uniref:RNase H type-1 domain-containing protein n=1 Tax=Arion vulgaris TaxID=1028688 RepID=A0A0B7ABL5_9EUPU
MWRLVHELLQASKIQRITFIFVLGHMGVNGNDRADILAKSATIQLTFRTPS